MEEIIQEIDQLLRGLQDAEEGSEEMNDLYIEFEEKIYSWLHGFCFMKLMGTYIPPDLEEDLSQNFHMKVFQYRHNYEPGTDAEGWLFIVLDNLRKDFLKTERQRKVTYQIDYECEELLSEAYAKDRRLFRENYRCRPKEGVNKAPERERDGYDESSRS